jgi:hypothetical protein
VTPTRTIGRYGRTYVWPEKQPYELQVPSVTTILSGGVPKPALAPWNAKMVATFAVKHKDAWQGLDDEDAIDLLKRSPFRSTDKAAKAGTLVHVALEAFNAGAEHVPVPKDKALKAQYDGALQFLRDFRVETTHTEVTIFSRQYGYAGTTDILGTVTLPSDIDPLRTSGRAIIDYKTGKAIYDEAVIQANAYAHGDFIAHGGPAPYEEPLGEFDFIIIVRPKRRGGYEAKLYKPSQEVLDVFLAAKVVGEREDSCRHSYAGRVLTGPEED